MNVRGVFDDAVASLSTQRAEATVKTYKMASGNFLTYLLELGIKETDDVSVLTVDVFIRYSSWLASAGYKKKTINVYSSASKFFLDWLVIEGKLLPDYQESVRLDKAYKAVRSKREDFLPRFPKRDDVDKVKGAVYHLKYNEKYKGDLLRARNVALIYFLAVTGCRNNEVVNLKIDNLDLVENQAVVMGKGSKERVVFFDGITAEKLKEYWTARGYHAPGDYVFTRHDNGNQGMHSKITTTTVRNVVTEAVAVAGIPKGKFSPHYFRHAFAIRMLRETGNLALVQDLLGHCNPNSTRIYAKIYPDELREAHRAVFGR